VHVASVVALAHVLPAAWHTASLLHVHVADKAAPLQLWCAPAQGAAWPSDQHPLDPRVQVASPPVTHEAWPEPQLFEHVSEHAPFGAVPPHVCGEGQALVALTYMQPFASAVQVARVALSSQAFPTPLQMVASQVHAAPASPEEQL
jgi:hypothetical protein